MAFVPDPTREREVLELLRAYARIQDPGVRRQVFDLVKAMAERSEQAEAPIGEGCGPVA